MPPCAVFCCPSCLLSMHQASSSIPQLAHKPLVWHAETAQNIYITQNNCVVQNNSKLHNNMLANPACAHHDIRLISTQGHRMLGLPDASIDAGK